MSTSLKNNLSYYFDHMHLKFILFITILLIKISTTLSQEELHRIPLPIKYAQDFEFIQNDHGKACLFLNRGDGYCIVLMDSNYQVLEKFRDSYYTTQDPRFVGSLTSKNGFELFFRRVEDDELLVLIIEIETKKLTRIKEFKISDNSNEKIVFTGSTIGGNKMITIAHDKNSLIYKKHLPGLKMESAFIALKEEDYSVVKKSPYIQIRSDADSLIILYKIEHKEDKNPYYKVFNIDINQGNYNTVDIICDHNRHKRYLHARLHENTVVLGNCVSDITLFDKLNGNLIKHISLELDSTIVNEDLPVFEYSYSCPLSMFDKSMYYKHRKFEGKDGLSGLNFNYDFIEESTGFYLQLEHIVYSNYGHCRTTSCIYLLFNWEKKDFITTTPHSQPKINDYIVYELDKRVNLKIDLTGYFTGFNDEFLFGYLTKNRKNLSSKNPSFELYY